MPFRNLKQPNTLYEPQIYDPVTDDMLQLQNFQLAELAPNTDTN
jgi:hypothetical protein